MSRILASSALTVVLIAANVWLLWSVSVRRSRELDEMIAETQRHLDNAREIEERAKRALAELWDEW